MHSEALERRPVDLDAETGSLWDRDASFRMFDRRREEGLPDRMLGSIEFQHRLRRVERRRREGGQHREELQRGGESDAAPPHMAAIVSGLPLKVPTWSILPSAIQPMDVVFGLADRVSVFFNGRKIAEDLPQAIQANADVRNAYLGNPAS